MARKVFKITELRRGADGLFSEVLAERFEWDAETQTSPRNAWEYAVRLRTVREDYPGATAPTEQVLGWNFEPFELEGMWDDKYAGSGFAENARVAFEAMVQRGNMVRIDFESITITGLITQFKATYHTSWRVGYRFTFSPHVREQTPPDLVPKAVANPDDYRVQVQAIVDRARALHALAPVAYLTASIYADVNTAVVGWGASVDAIGRIVDTRVLFVASEADAPVNSVARLAGAFEALASSAVAAQPLLRLPASTSLAFDSALPALNLEAWSRGLSYQARALMLAARAAAADLQQRVDGKARAIYRPYAGESLYAISNRFYGTPHRWRDIYQRNALTSIQLTGLETLVIPDDRSARRG